jgi:hypothetical protein
MSKGKDEGKEICDEYLDISEKVDMEGAEKWYQLGEKILGKEEKEGAIGKRTLQKEEFILK